jgi:NADH-quinone oxidoreductase subunit G
MHAHENVSESKPNEDPDSPLSYTMEGYHGTPPSSLIPFFWAPGWNSAQSINKYQIEVGGPLHGGDPGIRLLEPNGKAKIQYYHVGKEIKAKHNGKIITVPRYHIFGSGELSKLSPGIAELSPDPYIGVSHGDAEKLKVQEGESINVQANGSSYTEKVKIIKGLPNGLLAIPFELKEFSDITNEPEVEITKTKS